MDPRGDDQHLRDPSVLTAAPPVAIGIDSFRALDVGVQGKREPRRWPLAPGPRHHLMGPLVPAAEGEPFLRRERVWFLSGSLFPSLPSRTGGSEPSQQDGARTGKKEKQGGMD